LAVARSIAGRQARLLWVLIATAWVGATARVNLSGEMRAPIIASGQAASQMMMPSA
jgi:hypothetical protein